MQKLNIIYLMLFVLLVSSVSAIDYRFIGKQYDNISIIDYCYIDGANCPNSIPCNLTISGDTGILINNAVMDNNGAYLNYTLNNTYTQITKTYQASVVCAYNSTLSGNDNFYFDIRPYGDKKNEGNVNIALFIGLGILAIIFLLIYKFIDEEHWLFKFIIIFFVPLIVGVMGGLAANIGAGTILENASISFYKISVWFLRIFYTYVILAFIYSVFKSMGQNK